MERLRSRKRIKVIGGSFVRMRLADRGGGDGDGEKEREEDAFREIESVMRTRKAWEPPNAKDARGRTTFPVKRRTSLAITVEVTSRQDLVY